MPRSRGSAHARRRPHPPQKRGDATYLDYGVQRPDAISGVNHPIRLMVPQRGGLVLSDYSYGSRDVVDEVDGRYQPPVQPALPAPLYRVLLPSTRGALMLTEEERDAAVPMGYTWQVAGYAYPDGDEEEGLVKLYRLLNPGNANHLHTIDTDEQAAAVIAGFVAETDSVFVFDEPAPGRVAVSRYYNAVTATHYFTTDPLEIPRLPGTWILEGEKFYVLRGRERTRP
jgi:hypothetical protein